MKWSATIIRLAWVVVALFLAAHGAWGAGHDEDCVAVGGASVSSISCTFGSPLAAGHFLNLCVLNYNASVPTITWSGDSGTVVPYGPAFTQGSNYGQCYYVGSLGGGGSTITATASLAYPVLTLVEMNGMAGYVPNLFNFGATGSAPTASSNTITTVVNGEVLFGAVLLPNGAATVTATSPFTLVGASGTNSLYTSWDVQSTAGAISSIFSLSTSVAWTTIIAGFNLPTTNESIPTANSSPLGLQAIWNLSDTLATSDSVTTVKVALPTHSVNVTDNIPIVNVYPLQLMAIWNLTGEAILASDSVVVVKNPATLHTVTVSDGLITLDSAAAQGAHSTQTSEALQRLDSVMAAAAHLMATAESLRITDSVGLLHPVLRAASETLVLVESAGTHGTHQAVGAEVVAVGDLIRTSRGQFLGVSESLTVADVGLVGVGRQVTFSESLTITDLAGTVKNFPVVSVQDLVPTNAPTQLSLQMIQNLQDLLATVDSAIATKGSGVNRFVTFSESLTVTDSTNTYGAHFVVFTDLVPTVPKSPLQMANSMFPRSDQILETDAVGAHGGHFGLGKELLNLVDLAAASKNGASVPYYRITSDLIPLGDSLGTLGTHFTVVSDRILVSDLVGGAGSHFAIGTEWLPLADLGLGAKNSGNFHYTQMMAELVMVADLAGGVGSHFSGGNEGIPVMDVGLRLASFSRGTSDSNLLSDLVGGVGGHFVSRSETVPVGDRGGTFGSHLVTFAESVPAGDVWAALKNFHQTLTILVNENVPVGDVGSRLSGLHVNGVEFLIIYDSATGTYRILKRGVLIN